MEKLLTAPEVAEQCGMTVDAFQRMRHRGDGPVEIRLGHRTLRFRPEDVRDWLAARSNAA